MNVKDKYSTIAYSFEILYVMANFFMLMHVYMKLYDLIKRFLKFLKLIQIF
jgi:hypothetical protein